MKNYKWMLVLGILVMGSRLYANVTLPHHDVSCTNASSGQLTFERSGADGRCICVYDKVEPYTNCGVNWGNYIANLKAKYPDRASVFDAQQNSCKATGGTWEVTSNTVNGVVYSCRCSLTGTVWNGSACVCPSPSEWDSSVQKCITCPEGQAPRNGICQCKAGTEWETLVQACAPCARYDNNKIWDADAFACVCPQGTTWTTQGPLGLYGACVSSNSAITGEATTATTAATSCPGDQIFNGEFCVCPKGSSWNKNLQKCEFPLPTPGPVAVTCPSGEVWNANTQLCELQKVVLPSCSSNEIWNGSACVCLSGSERIGTSCVPCSGGKQSDGSKCVCPTGSYWNGESCIVCGSEQTWDTNLKQCVCGGGRTASGINCVCPNNGNWDGSSCIVCASNQIWDVSANKCVTPNWKSNITNAKNALKPLFDAADPRWRYFKEMVIDLGGSPKTGYIDDAGTRFITAFNAEDWIAARNALYDVYNSTKSVLLWLLSLGYDIGVNLRFNVLHTALQGKITAAGSITQVDAVKSALGAVLVAYNTANQLPSIPAYWLDDTHDGKGYLDVYSALLDALLKLGDAYKKMSDAMKAKEMCESSTSKGLWTNSGCQCPSGTLLDNSIGQCKVSATTSSTGSTTSQTSSGATGTADAFITNLTNAKNDGALKALWDSSSNSFWKNLVAQFKLNDSAISTASASFDDNIKSSNATAALKDLTIIVTTYKQLVQSIVATINRQLALGAPLGGTSGYANNIIWRVNNLKSMMPSLEEALTTLSISDNWISSTNNGINLLANSKALLDNLQDIFDARQSYLLYQDALTSYQQYKPSWADNLGFPDAVAQALANALQGQQFNQEALKLYQFIGAVSGEFKAALNKLVDGQALAQADYTEIKKFVGPMLFGATADRITTVNDILASKLLTPAPAPAPQPTTPAPAPTPAPQPTTPAPAPTPAPQPTTPAQVTASVLLNNLTAAQTAVVAPLAAIKGKEKTSNRYKEIITQEVKAYNDAKTVQAEVMLQLQVLSAIDQKGAVTAAQKTQLLARAKAKQLSAPDLAAAITDLANVTKTDLLSDANRKILIDGAQKVVDVAQASVDRIKLLDQLTQIESLIESKKISAIKTGDFGKKAQGVVERFNKLNDITQITAKDVADLRSDLDEVVFLLGGQKQSSTLITALEPVVNKFRKAQGKFIKDKVDAFDTLKNDLDTNKNDPAFTSAALDKWEEGKLDEIADLRQFFDALNKVAPTIINIESIITSKKLGMNGTAIVGDDAMGRYGKLDPLSATFAADLKKLEGKFNAIKTGDKYLAAIQNIINTNKLRDVAGPSDSFIKKLVKRFDDLCAVLDKNAKPAVVEPIPYEQWPVSQDILVVKLKADFDKATPVVVALIKAVVANPKFMQLRDAIGAANTATAAGKLLNAFDNLDIAAPDFATQLVAIKTNIDKTPLACFITDRSLWATNGAKQIVDMDQFRTVKVGDDTNEVAAAEKAIQLAISQNKLPILSQDDMNSDQANIKNTVGGKLEKEVFDAAVTKALNALCGQ